VSAGREKICTLKWGTGNGEPRTYAKVSQVDEKGGVRAEGIKSCVSARYKSKHIPIDNGPNTKKKKKKKETTINGATLRVMIDSCEGVGEVVCYMKYRGAFKAGRMKGRIGRSL